MTEYDSDISVADAQAHKDAKLAACVAATAIATGFVIYWSSEIQSVLEMLELAYG